MRAEDRGTLTVDEVYRMVDAGELDADAHVELLDGRLQPMSPQGDPHAALIGVVRDRLARAFGEGFSIRDHSPLRIDERNLPEPDIVVVRGEHRDYQHRTPTGADVALVVELAATSQARDRRKATTYARGGVPLYWIVDLERRTLTVHRDPAEGSYRQVTVLREGDDFAAPAGTSTWRVAELLP